MGFYRNHPRGMGGMSENISGGMSPIYLDELADTGNRSTRRWAKKKIAGIARQNAKQVANHAKR